MRDKYNILMRLSEITNVTYDKNNNILFGYMDKYSVSIQQFNNICFIIIPLKLNESYSLNNINKFFSSLNNNSFIASEYIDSISYNDYYISIKFTFSRNIINSCNNICNLLDVIISEAKKNRLQPCCPQCGDTSDIRPYLFNKGIIFRCGLCISKLEDGLEKREINTRKNNVFNNIFKSIIGALIGFVVLTALRLITDLNGFFAFILAFFTLSGYKGFKSKLTKNHIVFIVLLSTCMVVASNYISIGISLFLNNSFPNFMECINNIPYEIALSDYKLIFIKHLIISLISLFIGLFVLIKVNSNKNKKLKLVQELYY